MEKANGRSNSRIGPIEQPHGTDRGDESRTSWVTGQIDRQERKWAMFCHLAGLAGLSPILPVVGCAVAPLVIWQLKAEEFPFVAEQGRRAVNFQLSMLLYAALGAVFCLASIVGIFLIPVVFCIYCLVNLVLVLIAAVNTNRGRHYRYPFTIRFFK
ncbi:MAG: DUF4870 domain-containing protein [Planctomycetota bacterium]|jgi:uncharacterized Tic20 family protein